MRIRDVKKVNLLRRKFAITIATLNLSLVAIFVLVNKSAAQTTTPPTLKISENKDFRGNFLPGDYDIQKVAQAKISIDVKDANLFEIINAVSNATTTANAMEVRYPGLERISLKVKDMPLGDVLRGAATLNHLNLYVLPDRFVIGRYFMLSEEERKYIIQPSFDSPTPPVITKEEAQRNTEKAINSQK